MGTPIKYYYDLMSQPCRALYILLKLNKVPYEDKLVALRKGAHLTPDFQKNVNRFSKVPCIVDNGFQLSESVAILRHLARNGFISDEWYPKESKLRASVDEYLEWHHNNTRMHCTTYFRTSWLQPLLTGEKPDPEQQAELRGNMESVLDTIENIWLDKQKFIAGDRANVSDIFAACEIEQTRLAGYNAVEGRPKMKNWMEAVKDATNPSYNEAHQLLEKAIKATFKS